jgi:hypothetical protein
MTADALDDDGTTYDDMVGRTHAHTRVNNAARCCSLVDAAITSALELLTRKGPFCYMSDQRHADCKRMQDPSEVGAIIYKRLDESYQSKDYAGAFGAEGVSAACVLRPSMC